MTELTEGCEACDEHYFRQACRFGLKYTKKCEKKFYDEFFKRVNALLNGQGEGYVVVHVEVEDASCWIDVFDQKVDDQLLKLLPDGLLYHDVYERYFIEAGHLLYRVKPQNCTRTCSILNFKSKFPLNRGLIDPSQRQMNMLLSKYGHSATSFCGKRTFSGRQILDESGEATGSTVLTEVNLNQQPELNINNIKGPFNESLFIQAKSLPENGDKFENCWRLTKPYIPAFSKLKEGGYVFVGLMEKTQEQRNNTWTLVHDTHVVESVRSILTLPADYMVWEEKKAGEDAYHVMKDTQIPRKNVKTGKIIVQSVQLTTEEKERLCDYITQKIQEDFYWIGEQEPDIPITVKYVPVYDGPERKIDHYIVEMKAKPYNGLIFEDPEGPELYTRVYQGKSKINRVLVEDLLVKFKTTCSVET